MKKFMDDKKMKEKLKLNDITIIGVDGLDIDRLIKAATICLYYVDCCDVKVLSHKKPTVEYDSNIQFIEIESVLSRDDYSHFMIKRLNDYVDTKYCIVIQHDGFIINPSAWINDFLNYDYIGAPWSNNIVGNGGFSLRSKKLLEILATNDEIPSNQHEDAIISHGYWHDNILIPNGMKFPNDKLARLFSIEWIKWEGSFGFHSFYTDLRLWKDKNKFFGE
jgi:hypothetical protein